MRLTIRLRQFILASSALVAISSASAQTNLFWDANGATGGTGGLGTWTTASTWRSGSDTGTLGNWADGNAAVFAGTAGAVTLNSAVSASGLVFNTPGYTISGSGTLTLTGSPTITTTSGAATVISNVIAGSTGFTKTGVGILTLRAANTITGGVTVSGGSLSSPSELFLDFANSGAVDNNIIASTNSLTLGGGRLRMSGAIGEDNVQTFASTTLKSGYSDIVPTQGSSGTTPSVTLNLGAITREAGSVVWFAAPTGATAWTTTASTTEIVTTTGVTYNGVTYALPSSGQTRYVGAGFYQRTAGTGLSNEHAYVQINSSGQFLRAPTPTTWVNSGASATTVYNGGTTVQNLGASQSMYAISAVNTNLQTATVNLGNFNLGLNGIMQTETGTYTIQTAGSGKLQIGAERDLVLITTNTGSIAISAPIEDNAGGASSVTVQNRNTAGSVTLSGTNTFSGGLYLTGAAAGTLTMGSASALGSTSGQLTINGGTLNMAGHNLTVGNLTGSGGVISGTGTNLLTIGQGDNGGGNYQGQINNGTGGTTSLTKTGTGTITLSGTNGYTGATNVSNGTLAITGTGTINSSTSIAVATGGTFRYNSSVALAVAPTLAGNTVSNRAVLGGNGPIGVSVTLDNLGDVLSPGNSPGIQTYTVGQSWNSFSYDWEINDFSAVTGLTAGSDFDQIGITGSLNLTGGSGSYILNVLGLTAGDVAGLVPNFSEINRSWTILTTTGGITGFNATDWTANINTTGFTDLDTGAWALAQSGNDLVLSYTAIPEPGAALLGALGMLALLRRRR